MLDGALKTPDALQGRRYGLPYKGSKNSIAEWIVGELPSSDVFVDLFFGGGAITHCAMLSGKWRQFVANDIDPRLTELFKDCAFGKHTLEKHPEWVSREDFFRLRSDAFYALVWSFGNNGVDYMYSKEIEPFKKALHYACFFEDVTLFKELGIDIPQYEEVKGPYNRYRKYHNVLTDYKQLDQYCLGRYERLQSIEALQSLQSLQSLHLDYEEAIEKVKESFDQFLIYCDPPYNSTRCGKYSGFDNDRFIKWARYQDNIYISEYDMPDDFIPIAWKKKQVLSDGYDNTKFAIEKIYTNERTYEKFTREQKMNASLNFSEQMTIFDYMGDPYKDREMSNE